MCKTYRYGQLPFQWVDHQTVTGLDIRAGPWKRESKKETEKNCHGNGPVWYPAW